MKKNTAVITGLVFFLLFLIMIVGMVFFPGLAPGSVSKKENTGRYKIGMILKGAHDDRGWSQSHYDAVHKIVGEMDLRLVYSENVPVNRFCIDKINEMIDDGCKLIILDYAGYEQYGRQASINHPEVNFLNAMGDGYRENYSSFVGRMYQARYLLGLLAGKKTETNEIAYVGAFSNPMVNREINAFTLGVRKVNPEAEVYVRFSGSWDDDDLTAAATERLIKDHDADVILCQSNSEKPLEIGNSKGLWTLGYHVDNHELYPDTYLSAAVWEWEEFYRNQIEDCMNNRFKGDTYFVGMDYDMVDIAPITDKVSDEDKALVMAERERLINQEFDVFYGPLYDREGELRIPENESPRDRFLINEMDWYVPGVNIDE